jgi:hypothetical protein
MYDRPTAQELLDAARTHLETHVIPVIKGDRKLYFQTLVAINVLRIVERELGHYEAHLGAEWSRLRDLLQLDTPIPNNQRGLMTEVVAQNHLLAEAIRAGEYDSSQALFDHLKATTTEQLEVANPLFLMKILAEINDPSLDAWSSR